MRHHKTLTDVKLSHSWVTLGAFDGVHLGHQQIIRQLTSQAHQAKQPAVVVTFHPHPALVLSGKTFPIYLTTPARKAEILEQLGVDIVITYPFTHQTANLTAEEFIVNLNEHLNMRQLWVGYDFAMGKDRKGTSQKLSRLGEKQGYTLKQIAPFYKEGQIVSSSWIRELLTEGKVERAAKLLGRPHQIMGKVVKGDQRGKSLGFATANLEIAPTMARLRSGVYACYAWVNGERRSAVTNVGVRPTFEEKPVPQRIETHILGFSGDLYEVPLVVEFIAFLRVERKFTDIAALKTQITQDINRANQLLA